MAPPKDMTGVMQFSGTLAQMVVNPDALSSKAKVRLYEMCFSMEVNLTKSYTLDLKNIKSFEYLA